MRTPSKASKGYGFTLIELLVVISIIGMLASIILVSLQGARAKARDTTRKTSLEAIQKALELYSSYYGGYPSSACPNIDYKIPASLALEPKMAQFLPKMPSDPRGLSTCYNNEYLFISNQYNNCGAGNNALATVFTVYATLEDQSSTNLSAADPTDAWLMGGAGACSGDNDRPNFKLCSIAGCI